METSLSRVEAILQNILGADNVLVPPQSRVEEILLAILNNTEYIHPGDPSRVEEILLAIKDGGSYNKKALSRVEDILIHKLNDEEYTDYSEDDLSRVEKLLIQWIDLHPEVIKEFTTSSFPISILANGSPLLDYTIYGNSVQDGMPTPDSPIEPEFVGERTENLYNKDSDNIGYYKADTGEYIRDANRRFWMIKVSPGDTIYMNNRGGRGNGVFFDAEKNHISAWAYNRSSVVVPENVAWATNSYTLNTSSTAMVTLNTPIPSSYVPYGYKIPISSGGVTKNIYLGQTPTTRKIKKLVLTGEENWAVYMSTSSSVFRLNLNQQDDEHLAFGMIWCESNMYQKYGSEAYSTSYKIPEYGVALQTQKRALFINDNTRFETSADFKSYLAQQHSNGTPVKVWYVLAEPEVGIVNEPLCRIGDYADSVDFSQAGVEIPTLKKPNTTVIDVETNLEPSSMYLKYAEPSDGPAPKTPVLGTKDREIYVTPNNEVYVLRR